MVDFQTYMHKNIYQCQSIRDNNDSQKSKFIPGFIVIRMKNSRALSLPFKLYYFETRAGLCQARKKMILYFGCNIHEN